MVKLNFQFCAIIVFQIGKLNKDGAARYGRKWKDFSLNEDELKAFGDLKPEDEEGIKELFDKVGERIGKDYPATLGEKLIEGRRIAMLFNVRTLLRNFGANVPTEGMRYASDRIEGLGQKAYKLFRPDYEPSAGRAVAAGINDAQSRSIADEIWNSDAACNMQKQYGGNCNGCWINFHRKYDIILLRTLESVLPKSIIEKVYGQYQWCEDSRQTYRQFIKCQKS